MTDENVNKDFKNDGKFNFACPAIPSDLLPPDEFLTARFTLDCLMAWNEVVVEMTDELYATRSHHNPGTYNAGCKGPLCRKALRDKKRGLGMYALRPERHMDPILEYFHTVAKNRMKKVG